MPWILLHCRDHCIPPSPPPPYTRSKGYCEEEEEKTGVRSRVMTWHDHHPNCWINNNIPRCNKIFLIPRHGSYHTYNMPCIGGNGMVWPPGPVTDTPMPRYFAVLFSIKKIGSMVGIRSAVLQVSNKQMLRHNAMPCHTIPTTIAYGMHSAQYEKLNKIVAVASQKWAK